MLLSIKKCNWNIARKVSSTFSRSVGYKLKDNIKDCYSLLNVTEDSSMQEVKEAYFKLAKMYHPDSTSRTADQKKFEQVQDAYRSIKAHQSEQFDSRVFYGADEEDDDDYDMTKLRPQHRPYLENQGIGYGTPSERKKQFDQHRVSKAFSDISKYRIKKITTPGEESSLAVKDKKAAKRAKISNSMDRLVEDMIQQSMSRGEFENLPGSGKPLKLKRFSNPYTDMITEKLNNILIDSGVQPEWILLQKEIRMDLKQCRERFAIEKKLLGDGPYTDEIETKLKYHAGNLRASFDDINVKINKLNLLVPIMTQQLMPYDYNKEYVKIFNHTDTYLPSDFDIGYYRQLRNDHFSHSSFGDLGWKGVWDDFIAIFKTSKQ